MKEVKRQLINALQGVDYELEETSKDSSIELSVKVKDRLPFHLLEISFYPDVARYFLLIDDYRFEYEDFEEAKAEITKILSSLASNSLRIRKKKFLGMTYSNKLEY